MTNPGGLRTWTAARDDELRRYWAMSWTASKIADRFGISRNAVIGRVHRLNLPKRPNPVAKTENPSPEALYRRMWRRKQKFGEEAREEFCAARRARRKAAKPKPPAPKVPEKPKRAHVPRRVASYTGGDGCQWLDGVRPTWTKCGKARFMGSSWCEEHYHRVFQSRKSTGAA